MTAVILTSALLPGFAYKKYTEIGGCEFVHGNHCIKLLLIFNRNPLWLFLRFTKPKQFLQNLPKLETFINKPCQVTSGGGQWFVRPHEDQSFFHPSWWRCTVISAAAKPEVSGNGNLYVCVCLCDVKGLRGRKYHKYEVQR